MSFVRHTIVSFALAVTLWLAVGQLAPAAGMEPTSRTALTLTLSQRERGPGDATLSQRERGPGDATLYQRERGPWDAPNCRLEERLFDDAADGRLEKFSPLEAALVAGGVEDADCLHRYEQKAAALADELRRSGKLTGTPRQRVEVIFEFLHRRVLCGGYDLAYTDLRRVLDDGRFNCVSATVLFNYLAGQCGVECQGLEMPGHAMSRVWLMETVPFFLDVETTCPRWFQLMNDPRQQAKVVSVAETCRVRRADQKDAKTSVMVRMADPTSVAPGTLRVPTSPHTECAEYKRSKAREVSPIQLAAMIYYNRGVDLLGEKRFAEAARANAKALRLDPQNATARGNLLATLNNWSIELGNSEHFAEAVALLRQGLAMDQKYAAFAQNYVHVHHQWADHLCRQGQFAEAVKILSQAAAGRSISPAHPAARGD